jgi:hypothetical protein
VGIAAAEMSEYHSHADERSTGHHEGGFVHAIILVPGNFTNIRGHFERVTCQTKTADLW